MLEIYTEASVVLGRATITVRDLLKLSPGDVITLDQQQSDPLEMFIERAHRFDIAPMEKAGYLAAEIVASHAPRLPPAQTPSLPTFDEDGDGE